MQAGLARGYLPRSVSFRTPTAFCTLPAALSALPSASSLASPVTLPAASFTAPLACSAAPLMRSLSIFHLSLLGLKQKRRRQDPALDNETPVIEGCLYKIDHSNRRRSNSGRFTS